ncbi:MAG TPA: zinc-ribbon domain-containing protein [Myxococcales bacterium]|nr:zinc-ribbon domain-containing protein [Myxococcales bacterium]
MDVRCDKCQARYRIDEARVGPQGLAMRCGKCGNTFRAMRETAQLAAEPAPASPAPAPVAAAVPPAKAAVPAAAPPPKAAVLAAPATKPAVAPAVPAKPPAPAPPAAAPRAAPKPSEGGGATVMFSAPPLAAAAVIPAGGTGTAPPRAAAAPVQPPAAPARASAPAQKPAQGSAKAAGAGSVGSAVAPLGDEAAGRTMMFNATAPLKTPPPARTAAGTVKPLSKPTDSAGATLVFGAAPSVAQPPKAPAKAEPGANATMLFGNAAPASARPPAAQVPTPPPRTQTPPPPILAEDLAPEELAPAADAPAAVEAGEDDAAAEETEAAGQPEPAEQAPGPHGPPRALVIGVAAALGLVMALGGVVLAVKKLGHRAPPQAAVDALADAHAAADKDTLASLADAEAQTNAALQAAPKAHFPQAWAQLAEVQIAWSDALNDQAWYWSEQASRALASGDDKKKADAEAKAAALQDAAKARLKTAFESAAAGNKMDPKSPEVALALADYYRAARSRLNQNRELKRAALLKADEARIAFVQGAELLAQDEGGARALEKLKTALAGSPRSARIRFRMAMAYVSMRQDAEAKKELLATLDLSPQHERARMAMELLGPAGAPATGEGKRE